MKRFSLLRGTGSHDEMIETTDGPWVLAVHHDAAIARRAGPLTPDQQARALVVLRELVNAVEGEALDPETQDAHDAAAEFLASVGVPPFDPFEQENEP